MNNMIWVAPTYIGCTVEKPFVNLTATDLTGELENQSLPHLSSTKLLTAMFYPFHAEFPKSKV